MKSLISARPWPLGGSPGNPMLRKTPFFAGSGGRQNGKMSDPERGNWRSDITDEWMGVHSSATSMWNAFDVGSG